METYRCVVDDLGQLAKCVRGNKSHRFTTETGMKIYFDAQGIPMNVFGDNPVTNLEAHILERWTHEYYYNLVVTDPVTAINTIEKAQGSIILEVIGAINPGEKYRFTHWWWCLGSDIKFTVQELLHGMWYAVVDAY